MKNNFAWFGAAALAAALLPQMGCSGGTTTDGGTDSGFDSGPDCVPSDAGYCGVCHVMTACGEYPPGPYGMSPGQTLPPCFQDLGFWNPTAIWLEDGGNPVPEDNVQFFQNLHCANDGGARYALIQVVTIADHYGQQQSVALAADVPYWLDGGGQVMQLIEQGVGSVGQAVAPVKSDLVGWVSTYPVNYSMGNDTNQVLGPLIDANMGWPVTFMVDLKSMVILTSRSYRGDYGGISFDFTQLVYPDGG